jgi:hypothetical protein
VPQALDAELDLVLSNELIQCGLDPLDRHPLSIGRPRGSYDHVGALQGQYDVWSARVGLDGLTHKGLQVAARIHGHDCILARRLRFALDSVPSMALITRFVHRPGSAAGYRSEVECGYRVVNDGSKTLLHLETYGSSNRAIPGKISQSLQLDLDGARELRRLIDQAFPELAR